MEEKKKTDSRKFVVWLTWLIISVLMIAWCTIVILITKQITELLVGLIEKVLAYFFAVSMMYLGVNVGQKAAFALSDAIMAKSGDKEGDE